MVHLRSQPEHGMAMPAKIIEVESLVNEAMDMLRDISRSLNPENITGTGWQQSFLNELERIDRSKLFSIQTTVSGVPFTIDHSKQIILFRILQEAMNNIVKHSQATKVNVSITYAGDELNIAITDDGKGMADSKSLPASGGAGLRNMKARAVMLPAALDINSLLGHGTTIQIRYRQTG
jgi:signal transduction histidine kinase